MIQFKQVSKDFEKNKFFAIKDLDFTIDPGEMLFLIGPSGSGKTTVIKLITREILPTSGQIYLDDFDITKLNRKSIHHLRRQIGVVFQDYKLISDKTVAENVAFAMEVAGAKNKEIKETVPYLLDIVGLTSRKNAFPAYLSGGEKQRVAIARAVANNPKILIADEPTGNLDPAAAWDIMQILSKINNWGTTVIMSTHGTEIVNTLGKRVIQMQDGRIIRDDKTGGYEKTKEFEEQIQQAKHSFEEQEKVDVEEIGPIKVKLKTVIQTEDEKTSRGLFSWIGRKKVNKTEKAILIEDADSTLLSELDLPRKLVKKLKKLGYYDVEDIISAGIVQLEEDGFDNPEELLDMAERVKEFVEQDLEEIDEYLDEVGIETTHDLEQDLAEDDDEGAVDQQEEDDFEQKPARKSALTVKSKKNSKAEEDKKSKKSKSKNAKPKKKVKLDLKAKK